MKSPLFTGTSTAIITPFNDGGVNFPALSKLIDQQIKAGVSAITVCGTTGESSAMTYDERVSTIEFTVRHCAGRVKVIAGTGSNNTESSLRLSLDAQRAGADTLLMVTPYYNKTTQAGLIAHYIHVADRVELPIILYNVPSRTGLSFKAETYKELSRHPNINGVKEASGNLALAMDTIRECGNELHLWSGNDDQIVPLMSIGAKGVISVASNLIPDEIVAMTTACLNGDYQAAGAMQIKYSDLIAKLFCEVNPIPIKAAMNAIGFEAGSPRLPLVDMSVNGLEKLQTAMKAVGIHI